jgi:hypothetical protein
MADSDAGFLRQCAFAFTLPAAMLLMIDNSYPCPELS